LQTDPALTEAQTASDDTLTPAPRVRVVGIGASAGGLEALERFFRAVPARTGITFVVVQHLSLDFKSMMPELLSRYTLMPVIAAAETMAFEPDTVYVIVPGREIAIQGRMLLVEDRRSSGGMHLPINTLFTSLAALGPCAAAIVMSGTGSDGSVGAPLVRAAGGLVIAQTPSSARFDGMPRSVIETNSVDIVTDPEHMPAILRLWIDDPEAARRYRPSEPEVHLDGFGERYGAILGRLQAAFDIDFQQYKPNTIVRRIERRLSSGLVPLTPEDYTRKITENRSELDLLFNDLLIGVTSFFRDSEAFKALYERAILPLALGLPPTDDLRIWSCACSTGEEAYTLAILALEAFDQHGLTRRVRVLATDLHGPSLQVASAGVYSAQSLKNMPEVLRDKYFIAQPDGDFKASSELRRCVVFSPHNVTRDAGFTRMHVVSCRNMLIYLQQTAQTRALASFHTALVDGGALFLGESEGTGDLHDLFDEIDRSAKLFRRRPEGVVPPQVRALMNAPGISRTPLLPARTVEPRTVNRLYEQLLNRYAPSGVLVNASEEVLHVFGEANRFLQPALGRFRSDLGSMLNGEMKTAVFIALRKAKESGETLAIGGIAHRGSPTDAEQTVSIHIDPFPDRTTGRMHFMIRFVVDEAPAHLHVPMPMPMPTMALQTGVHVDANSTGLIHELESELQDVRETLQHTIEELEAANEELQAGNEELMAANEELQSTNEELHAVNEELYTVNSEHELRIRELHATTADLNNFIRSTDLATLFVDANLRLRLFTPGALELFPIQPIDRGRALTDFRPRTPDPELFRDLAAVIERPATIEKQLHLEGGRSILRRISPYRDSDEQISGAVLTYLDVSDQAQLNALLLREQRKLRDLIVSLPVLVWSAGADGAVQFVSPSFAEFAGLPAEALHGVGWLNLLHPEEVGAIAAAWRWAVDSGSAFRAECRLRVADGNHRWVDLRARPARSASGAIERWDGVALDIDPIVQERSEMRQNLAQTARRAARDRALFEATPVALLLVDAVGKILQSNAAAELLLAYPHGVLTEMKLDQFVPVAEHPLLLDLREDFRRRPLVRLTAPIKTLHLLRHDGDMVEVTMLFTPMSIEDEVTLVMIRETASPLEREAQELRASQAKGTFLATMSHEIRTPLNAILGTTQLLQLESPSERQTERLKRIEDASTHLLSIVNDVLDLAKVESGNMKVASEVFDVHALVGRSTGMIETAARTKGLDLIVRHSGTLPGRVRGDPRRIEQVLVNLLNNALKFTPRGSITVRVRCGAAMEGHAMLRFEVKDTGIGIPESMQVQVFEPFQQVEGGPNRAYGGTGLGLAISREMARAMHGDAGLTSVPGRGSTFWFSVRVQLADDEAAPVVRDDKTLDEALLRKLAQGCRLLLVEDDEVGQLVAAELLRAATGIAPEVASSGAQALSLARSGRYDLVFMDMQMPGMDGLETTRALRKLRGWKRTPIIALTANAFDDDRERCLAAGMNAHLPKPLTRASLAEVLLRWLARGASKKALSA